MKILRLASLLCAFTSIAVACGETDENAPAANTDAGTLDAAKTDATTAETGPAPDSGGADVVVPQDAGQDVTVVDSAVECPISQDATISAVIKVTADDYLKLYFNGTLVDDKQTTWGTVDSKNVTVFLHPGRKNVIAIEARNAFNTGGLDRGLLADLAFTVDGGTDAGDGGLPNIVTDTSWKMLLDAPDAGVPDGGAADAGIVGWFDNAFDDSSWGAAFDEGAHGISPWGSVFGTSTAHWLWAYNSATANSKPASEVVFFRKTFYMDVNGVPQSTPPSCP